MEITEVRIKLMDEASERLQAFCSITFDDCFVIRDLKIIEGTSGPFVAMPSRKLTSHCSQCGSKNHLRAAYCNQCGHKQHDDRSVKDAEGRAKLYADIAHPINSACREMIQNRVIEEFHLEQDRAKQPGYVSRYDDFDLDYDADPASPAKSSVPQTKFEAAHEPRAPHKMPPRTAPQPAPRAESSGPHSGSSAPSGTHSATHSSSAVPPPHQAKEHHAANEHQAVRPDGPQTSGGPKGDFGKGIF